MRILFFTFVSILFCTQSFAAKSNCASVAGDAAFKLARPEGNRPGSSVFAAVESSKLVKQSGLTLVYKVQISFDATGGYSDGFPPETYAVTASGSEHHCRIVSVKLVK